MLEEAKIDKISLVLSVCSGKNLLKVAKVMGLW